MSGTKGIEPFQPSDTLSNFLRTTKASFLEDVRKGHTSTWTVVMGNESGDLDSVASSIGFAWVQTEIHKKQTVPLMQIKRPDFALRAENLHALSLAGIKSDAEELLSIDDVPRESGAFPAQNFALVDHNRLLQRFSEANSAARVTAVIDHHEDEKLYADTADPRVIRPAGSCASLVTTVLNPAGIPTELATLLLCAVLIDTNGLKEGGKALDVDHVAAANLLPRSALAESVGANVALSVEDRPVDTGVLRDISALKDLSGTLGMKKGEVLHLTVNDLLRRDYKQYTLQAPWAPSSASIQAGLSTVPLGLKDWMARDDFWESSEAFMTARDLSILGILTSFRSKGSPSKKPKHKRQMVWLLREANGLSSEAVEELAQRLWTGLEGSTDLQVKQAEFKKYGHRKREKPPTIAKARVYRQGNPEATRKATAPLLKKIVEAS